MGVESICFPAFRAKRYNLVRATIQRGIILLLFTSLPVSLLWINTKKILEMLKQDEDLAAEAHIFLLYSVPDLLVESFLHPLRAYLKIQSKTLPLSICTAIANILHLPITFLLVQYLGFGMKGIALSGVLSNFNLVVFLVIYIAFLEEKQSSEEEVLEESYEDSLREWKKLLVLTIPIPIEMIMAFWFWFGFQGLWLGMLAAHMACLIGRMVATCMTNWELEAARARELTAVDGGSTGDGVDVEAGKVIILLSFKIIKVLKFLHTN
ncbi:protein DETOXIFICATION 50 [Brassica rapa]|uniref:Polysaccharide biosynthesis protein C-terminal domain-containing protein n=1 Tax=Brassica campestris TaxID=3711 RepID=M4CDQ8_BRACM|nr:protein DETOXIFICATION 50 [Brassica rapa]